MRCLSPNSLIEETKKSPTHCKQSPSSIKTKINKSQIQQAKPTILKKDQITLNGSGVSLHKRGNTSGISHHVDKSSLIGDKQTTNFIKQNIISIKKSTMLGMKKRSLDLTNSSLRASPVDK